MRLLRIEIGKRIGACLSIVVPLAEALTPEISSKACDPATRSSSGLA